MPLTLGFQTDLTFIAFDGEVADRGDYIFAASPLNPAFHFGNMLIFRAPPKPADAERWPRLFRQEFASRPEVRHVTLIWARGQQSGADEQAGVEAFLRAGFRFEEDVVLTARAVVPPPHPNRDVLIRPVRSPEDWERVLANQVASRDPAYEIESYTDFKRRQIARWQAMIAKGRGEWFGAFAGDRMVADLGVFVHEGLGRFQAVGTDPAYRGRGICGTLVHAAAREAFTRMGAKELVMVADENYHAARIYESVGFKPTERQGSLCLRPGDSRA